MEVLLPNIDINMYVRNLQFFIQKNIDGLVNSIYFMENKDILVKKMSNFRNDQKINIKKWISYFKMF